MIGGQTARPPRFGDTQNSGGLAVCLGAAGLLYATAERTATRTLAAAMASEYEPKDEVASVVMWALEGQRVRA